jgi:hypothetical protein
MNAASVGLRPELGYIALACGTNGRGQNGRKTP